MQLRSKYKPSGTSLLSKYVLKFILLIVALFAIIIFLNKLEIPAQQELIKQEISNDKLIKLK